VLNETEKALEQLDKLLSCGYDRFSILEHHPDLNNIRQLPQFKAILQKYKQPE
jgi:hypothetical protein